MSFDERKAQILSSPPFVGGRDASPKGGLDAPILDCVAFLNSLRDFVTTSSCAGRVSLYLQPETKGVEWLLVEHGPITVADLVETVRRLPEGDELVVLKCEAFILHLLCRDLQAASLLLGLARDCGYRESGIVAAKQITLAVRTTAFGLEMPVAVGNRLLLDEEGVAIAVREANRRILANFERTDRFLLALKQRFGWPSLRVTPSSGPVLKRWGHSSFLVAGDVVTVGGYGCDEASSGAASRRLRSIRWSPGTQKVTLLEPSLEVVHAAMVYSESVGSIVCSGGRLSPLAALPCLRLFSSDLSPIEAVETGEAPSPRWGHSLTSLGSNTFLLYGGRDGRQVFADAFALHYLPEGPSWEWRRLPTLPIPGRFFHAACAVGDTSDIIVHGGVVSLEDCWSDHRFYRLSLAGRCVEINLDTAVSVPRFGHTLTYLGTKTYLFFGGSSFHDTVSATGSSALTEDGSCLLLDLRIDSKGEFIFSVRELPIGPISVIPFQRSRIHHQTIYNSDLGMLTILGGGIHCLAFGPTYCDSIEFSIGDHHHPPFIKDRQSTWSEEEAEVSPRSEEKPNLVILTPPRKVKSLKVFLEEHGWLDKTKRITRFEHQGNAITTMDLASNVRHQGDLPLSFFDSMAVPITQEFLNLLMSEDFEMVGSKLTSLPEIVGTSQLYIHEQRVRLNKRSQVDCHRKAREVRYPI